MCRSTGVCAEAPECAEAWVCAQSTRIVHRGMGLHLRAQGVRGLVLPEDGGVTKGVDFGRELGDMRVIALGRMQGRG